MWKSQLRKKINACNNKWGYTWNVKVGIFKCINYLTFINSGVHVTCDEWEMLKGKSWRGKLLTFLKKEWRGLDGRKKEEGEEKYGVWGGARILLWTAADPLLFQIQIVLQKKIKKEKIN